MKEEKTLYDELRDKINRHCAKDTDRENLILIMNHEHKKELSEMIQPNIQGLDKIHEIKIYCTAKADYAEPLLLNLDDLKNAFLKLV